MHLMSPNSDIVGPSPVTSNGTETTEIEDDEVSSESGLHHEDGETGSQPQVKEVSQEPTLPSHD